MTDEELQRQADEDLRSVLSTVPGRRFVWRLVDGEAGVATPSFAGEQTHGTAYREGKRAVGLQLVLDCQRVAPTDYVQMVSEAVSRSREARLAREQAKEQDDAG